MSILYIRNIMNRLLSEAKDFLIGSPETRLADVNADLEKIKVQIEIIDKTIFNLENSRDPRVSEASAKKQILELKDEKKELLKVGINKNKALNDVKKESQERTEQDFKETRKDQEKAIVSETSKEAADTAEAIASAKIAIRKAKQAIRKRSYNSLHSRRAQGGKKKSQKKRRTNKRK